MRQRWPVLVSGRLQTGLGHRVPETLPSDRVLSGGRQGRTFNTQIWGDLIMSHPYGVGYFVDKWCPLQYRGVGGGAT